MEDIVELNSSILQAKFHRHGAALHQLIYKPSARILTSQCPAPYLPNHYLGTIVGPVANRIANAQFTLDNHAFALDANEGTNCLHGGRMGLSELDWQLSDISADRVSFEVTLADGHMGFPGPSHFKAIYQLDEDKLHVNYYATSPRNNYFNLAPHFYFNLNGDSTINQHSLWVDAAHYLPVDAQLIPVFGMAPLADTAFDFYNMRAIGDMAIDHHFCFRAQPKQMRDVLKLVAEDGMQLQLSTNQVGVQIYDARHMARQFLAIEPQACPNAMNHPDFCDQLLVPANQPYEHKSCFRFSHHRP